MVEEVEEEHYTVHIVVRFEVELELVFDHEFQLEVVSEPTRGMAAKRRKSVPTAMAHT